MIARLVALMLGGLLLLVGVVGLVTPVSVSPGMQTVQCGTAVAPDLAAARAQAPAETEISPMDLPYSGELVGKADYSELCRYELADRRAWTVTLAGTGAFVLVVAGAFALRARHAQRSS